MNIRFCGIGGQGIVMAAYILGKAAIEEGKNAVQTKSYGSAYRGTLCKSDVIISERAICELEFIDTDLLICLSQEGFAEYHQGLKADGHLFYDDSLVKIPHTCHHIHMMRVFQRSRKKFQSPIFGNMMMLGYLTGTCTVVSKKSIEKSIAESVPAKTIVTNIDAFLIGFNQAIGENKTD